MEFGEQEPQKKPSTGHSLLFGPAKLPTKGCTPASIFKTSAQTRVGLIQLYCDRVDCLYKILHWPTTIAALKRSHEMPQSTQHSPALVALEHAMCFMAIRSITDDETVEFGFGDRALLTEQYRSSTERLISEADMILRPNVTVLQAFVIYLVSTSTPQVHYLSLIEKHS
jgi:hypothetical protein